MTHALFMTKAAPLHYGHVSCIDKALKYKRVTVVVYETDVIDVPLRVRAQWIRDLYHREVRTGKMKVIEAWGAPTETGYTAKIMRAHEDYIYGTLCLNDVTHVVSSEPYGEHMAKAVGAKDVRVDEDRLKIPLSGTLIRERPYTYRSNVPYHVYQDLVTRVCVIGAPSTGKTTLVDALAREYGTLSMHEHGRDYWQKFAVDRLLSNDQLLELACQHKQMENRLVRQAKDYLFVDTNPLTTMLFAEEYWGEAHPKLVEMARRTTQEYDLLLMLDTSIPFDDTPERDGPEQRDVFQRRYFDVLHSWRIPYVMVTGASLAGRIKQVERILSGFKKWKGVGC